MANVSAPYGFLPIRTLHSAGESGSVRRYKKEASVIIAPGDPVVLTGSSEAVTGIPLITRAAGTEATPATITGVVVGIEPIRSDLSKKHLAAADTGYVLVADDPRQLFQIQANGAFAVGDVGNTAACVVTNANTTVGKSQVMLDSANIATGTQLQIMEMLQKDDNELGTYADLVVRINVHTYGALGTAI